MRRTCGTTSTTGIDEAIVIDNGSTDGTFELMAELAEQLPIQLASEIGHIYQSEPGDADGALRGAAGSGLGPPD